MRMPENTKTRIKGGARRGLTLIEVVVVLVVIGILTAILIPAVAAMRESARQAQCTNNLRQIGLGLSNYLSTHDMFPAGNSSRGFSSLVMILPHIEQSPLYHSINFENGAATPPNAANTTSYSSRPDAYHCPSDEFVPEPMLRASNYGGNQGAGVQKFGYNGAFAMTLGLRPANFTDGLSSTAFFSEFLASGGENRDIKRAVFASPVQLLAEREFTQFCSVCALIDPTTAEIGYPFKGWNWTFGDFGQTLYNHSLGPNQPSCLNGNAYQQGIWSASSRHRAGVNVLFGDMRVVFVHDSIELAAWRGIASRNGGEVTAVE